MQHHCAGCGIVVEFLQHLFQVAESCVQQRLLESCSFALDDEALMHRIVAEACVAAFEQTGNVIRPPA